MDILWLSWNLLEFGDELGEFILLGSVLWVMWCRLVGYGWVDGFCGECSGYGCGGDERGWVSRVVGDVV